MRVLLDCRYVRTDHHDGISRYSAGLAHALARLHPVELLVCDTRQLAQLPDAPWHVASGPTSVREPFVALQVNRLRPDVVFTPLQTMGSWGRTYPLVLTLHDVIYHHHRTPPRDLAPWLRLLWRAHHLTWWPQRLLLRRADAVVTVSATTAAAIARHRLARGPVTVVPNAAQAPRATAGVDASAGDRPPPDGSRGRALVCMGSFMPYKNVGTLVRAVADLPGYALHLMSRVPPAERERLVALAGPAAERLVFHDGASEETYRAVLAGASALLSASREEGFGIPLVEAMSAGVPVVVSDIPVFHEVGGGAARYVGPDDVAAFVAAVRSLEDPTRWAVASRAGVEQAARFGWDASARVLLDLLLRVAGSDDAPRGDHATEPSPQAEARGARTAGSRPTRTSRHSAAPRATS